MTENEDCIRKFIDGDAAFLKQLYAKNYFGVEAYILKNSGTKEQARDVFQHGLLVLYTLLKKEKLQISNFDNYLFTVCKNFWIKQSSQNSVTKLNTVTLVDESPDLASFHIEQLQWNLFKEKLESLKETCKTIIKLTLAKVSYAEISKKLKFSNENAARQKAFRCKTKLFKMIQADVRFKKLKNN
ncbi:sigma-70 family RNA polymerase sigma factor [Kordia algicida OT-1]|uniref:DNA-directed RNA polymerase specialized sigma subunit n=1 Tax=Kordia algicida OT-1 TaxID=391587 RepID=A9EBX7_9FLAO|nr:sigma-70 family RNA polymerase sigma factor [Kordia algicida]EDP94409.1 DNA-directed RNA polymerase specialized sigma subunit [Kordia algicida OT-1]